MENKKMLGNTLLMLTAFIWGTAFVAQSLGNNCVGPFTFNGLRSLIGAVFLLVLMPLIKKIQGNKEKKYDKKIAIKVGMICGIIMFAATSLQQVGINYTTVGKAGFITALYIIIVPILGIFVGKKPGYYVWISVGIALVGMYLLCMNEKLVIGLGDTLVILCAIVFSFHIMMVDHFANVIDGVMMSCIQFTVCGILSLPVIFAVERPNLMELRAATGPMLYAGILSCGVAYTLQIVGQKYTDPFIASLIMSLESVFSALSGWIILKETMSAREIKGALLMFGAIILIQVMEQRENRKVKVVETE